MKCEKCIFAKEIDKSIIKCINPFSAQCENFLVNTVGGCERGSESTVGINQVQQERIKYMKYF